MSISYYLPADGIFITGKNSDGAEPEYRSIRLFPGLAAAEASNAGGLRLGTPDRGFAMVLSCPPGKEGADAGVNERGVAICAETVRSRFRDSSRRIAPSALVQAALVSSSSAEDARDKIVALVEGSGRTAASAQADDCDDGSYLITGPDGAFSLESAGSRWAWKSLDAAKSISTAYVLGTDYKRLDPATRKAIAPVNERMACLDEADAGRIAEKESWKRYVEPRWTSLKKEGEASVLAADTLLAATLEANAGRQAAFAVLRSHGTPDPRRTRKTVDLCRHPGAFGRRTTIGSFLVERSTVTDRFLVWFTGSAYPCANLFKPILFDGAFEALWEDYNYSPEESPLGEQGSGSYSERRREAARALRRRPETAEGHAARLAASQALLGEIADSLLAGTGKASPDELARARSQVAGIVAAWDAIAIL